MDGNIVDEPISPDIVRPRYLFRRYDSASGSSDSSRSSFTSSSRGSVHQSPRRQNDHILRRTRTTTLSYTDDKSSDEESTSNVYKGNARDMPNGKTRICKDFETPDDTERCMFCDMLVHERQYYLWHSNYTKSSLCSRCSEDNDGMRYISYWGSPSYETGSWRKRYTAGRSTDIDLSPLLEVLERIDRIDTSIGGRKSTSSNSVQYNFNANNVTKNGFDIESTDIKESNEMTARRRRRFANRKVIDYSNEINSNCERIQDTEAKVACKKINERSPINRAEGKLDLRNDKKEKDGSYDLSEICEHTEQVDIIEPLNVISFPEPIPVDNNNIKVDSIGSEHSTTSKQADSQEKQNLGDVLSAENIANYRKGRRKSNYEEFLAGLEPVSLFKRSSSTVEDLGVYCRQVNTNKNATNYELKSNFSRNSTSESDSVVSLRQRNDNIVVNESTYLKKIHGNGHVPELKVKDTDRDRHEKDTEPDKSKGKRKSKRTNISCPVENLNEQVNSKHKCRTDTKGAATSSLNKRRKSKTVQRTMTPDTDSSSSDDTKCVEAKFSDIKRRFENFSNGTAPNKRPVFRKRFNKVSKGHFRSRYMKMTENTNGFHPDEDTESEEDNDGKFASDKRQNSTEEDDLRSDTRTSQSTELNTIDAVNDTSGQSENITIDASEKNKQQMNENKCNEKTESSTFIPEGDLNDGVVVHENETDNQTPDDSDLTATDNVCKMKSVIKETRIQKRNTQELDIFQYSQSSSDSNEDKSDVQQFKEDYENTCNNAEDMSTIDLSLDNGNHSAQDCNIYDPIVSKEENTKSKTPASAREKKYKQRLEDTEHENPNIERIRKKLSRKPKYEDEDSNTCETEDKIMELNGSDDEEVELGWRTRGYNTDFYMSRRSVTGREILDRYQRAISNRRSKNNSQKNSRRSSRNSARLSIADKILTNSEPVSRCDGLRNLKSYSSAPITRSNTQLKLSEHGNEIGDSSGYRQQDTNCETVSSGVSATELKAALNRAAVCSERMSLRLKSQLRASDSGDSSS